MTSEIKYGKAVRRWNHLLKIQKLSKSWPLWQTILNAPNQYGSTPIFKAAWFGHTEIVKILAPLTDDINAPNDYEETPSSVAKNDEILRILQSFVWGTSRMKKDRKS